MIEAPSKPRIALDFQPKQPKRTPANVAISPKPELRDPQANDLCHGELIIRPDKLALKQADLWVIAVGGRPAKPWNDSISQREYQQTFIVSFRGAILDFVTMRSTSDTSWTQLHEQNPRKTKKTKNKLANNTSGLLICPF